MTRVERELEAVEAAAAFAPLASLRMLERMLQAPRLLPVHRGRIMALIRRIETARAVPRLTTFSVVFPVVSALPDAAGTVGGVAVAQALPLGVTWTHGASFEAAFPDEAGARRVLRELGANSGVAAWVDRTGAMLSGRSAGAAFALAIRAAMWELPVPPDIAVSAAIERSLDGSLHLAAVADCDRKRRVLEVESPGCRFFYVSNEPVAPSPSIQLVPLSPGPIEELYQHVFGVRTSVPTAGIMAMVAAAEHAWEAQHYDESAGLYWTIVRALHLPGHAASHPESALWRFLAWVRLAGASVHFGRGDQAGPFLAAAAEIRTRAPALPVAAVAEEAEAMALRCIDHFDPNGASDVIAREMAFRRARWEREGDAESRLLVVGALGLSRLLALLLGDAAAAVAVQNELVALCPPEERARGLVDLGECLRRQGRFSESRAALAAAREALPSARAGTALGTLAFILYCEGRVDLDRGVRVSSVDEVRDVLAVIQLPAAMWRLKQLCAMARVQNGDAGGIEELISQLAVEGASLRQWLMALGLLRAARVEPACGERARTAAAGVFAPDKASYPALDDARRRWMTAWGRGGVDAEAEGELLRRTAY